MPKLKLVADPTFRAKVGIPVAGGDAVEVEMTFKHRTKKQLEEFVNSRAEKSDVDSFMAMVEGWDLEDDFTKKNVGVLLENYIGAALQVYKTYVDQLVKAKLGN
jgi:hypothetical protein